MAPNPSAALRVGLAALLAAGPLQPAFAADTAVAGRDYVVLQVGDVVPTYNGIMVKASDLAGLKKDQEKEVDGIVPSAMERQGTLTAHTYKLIGAVERVKVKVVEEPRTMGRGRYQLFRAGKWVAGRDNKPASFEGCVPNGDSRCFNGIRGVARNFILATTAAAPAPAPAPVPPAPAPGQPRPAPVPGQPAPPPAPETLKDWAFIETADGPFAVGKATYDGAKRSADACAGAGGFVSVPLYAFKFADDQKDKPLAAAAEDKGLLKVYKTGAPGQPLAWCPKGRDCAAEGTEVSARACEATACRGLTINRPAENRAGTPLVAADLDRPFSAKAGTSALSGKSVVAPTVSPACAGDELDRKLDELFGSNKVERAGADWVAETYGGKTGPAARAAMLEALKGPQAAAKHKEVRDAVRKEAAKHVASGKPELAPFVGKRGVTKEDIAKYICDLLPTGDGSAAAPTGGATSARAQLGVAADNSAAAAGATSDAGARGTAQIDERAPAAAQNPAGDLGFEVTPEIKTQCAIFRSTPAPQRPGPIAGPGTGPGSGADVPTPHGRQVTPDKAAADTSAEDAKKKKDLQRMAIGGMGGAIVLGVFGFIFGGPIGAIAMGAIGFGLMAGVTYLNNNPIDK